MRAGWPDRQTAAAAGDVIGTLKGSRAHQALISFNLKKNKQV